MDPRPHDDTDLHAARSARLIAHLDGALDAQMLDAMATVWMTLEHAAADGAAHARAVRSRMFWESMRPGGAALAPVGTVQDLLPAWDPRSAAALDPVEDELLDADAA